MKYKPLDRVRIKSLDWYNENKDNYGAVYAGNGFAFWNYMAGLCGEIMTISSIKIDPEDSNKGYYFMENSEEKWTDEMIEGLVEEITNVMDEDKMLIGWIKEPNRYRLVPDKDYEIKYDEKGFFYLEKKKKEYPKTYGECLSVLEIYNRFPDVEVYNAKPSECKLFESFIRLKRCRDAYWKIAGEEMGLDGPWKPDCNRGYFIPSIIYRSGFIQKVEVQYRNAILSFPTPEMRDAFYENFKKEIEDCKELLKDDRDRFFNFLSLVKRMREAQKQWRDGDPFDGTEMELAKRMQEAEKEVDEYLKKMEI